MSKMLLHWRKYIGLMAVLGILLTGLIIGCGKNNNNQSSSNSALAVESDPGTGEVVLTGRIQ
jgi:hypothetical protein